MKGLKVVFRNLNELCMCIDTNTLAHMKEIIFLSDILFCNVINAQGKKENIRIE